MCNISIQAIACGNISGSYSEPLITALQGLQNTQTIVSDDDWARKTKHNVITPRACARGKAIIFVCRLLSVIGMKITRSRDLGIQVTCKHNESVEFGKKLASVCSKSFDTAHESHK